VGPLLLPLLISVVAGCGGSSSAVGSCDTRTINSACQDYDGPHDVVAVYKQACSQGTWSDSACNRTGTVGGCRAAAQAEQVTITDWFFAPQTNASVKDGCMAPDAYVAS
jgi:hypothetical protein